MLLGHSQLLHDWIQVQFRYSREYTCFYLAPHDVPPPFTYLNIVQFANCYMLAMASTAMAVMLGCSVEDPKLGQEMLPLLFVPQMLFAGFFVAPDLIPIWLR